MLVRIFGMQAELNDHIFKTQSLFAPGGKALDMQAIHAAAQRGELGVNDIPNQWLARYAQAMQAELKELEEELLWKWWSRDEIDLQNIRVELADVLHFLISAMISAGMTAEHVFDIYRQKHAVNVQRQDEGYSKRNKDEGPNRAIA